MTIDVTVYTNLQKITDPKEAEDKLKHGKAVCIEKKYASVDAEEGVYTAERAMDFLAGPNLFVRNFDQKIAKMLGFPIKIIHEVVSGIPIDFPTVVMGKDQDFVELIWTTSIVGTVACRRLAGDFAL